MSDLDAVLDVLRTTRFCWATEDDLQQGLAAALEERGLPVEREVRLDEHRRIDLVAGRVGIEVKVAGSWRDVARQVSRYRDSEDLDAVVVVTSKPLHRRLVEKLPVSMAQKPVVVHLAGSTL